MIRPCSLAKPSLSFCVSSSKGVYAVRVRSVAHGVDDFITVPSRFLERNNNLVGLLDFIVQSSQRLKGIAGSWLRVFLIILMLVCCLAMVGMLSTFIVVR